ncbi:MAG TPA: nuclear transport factor 2 family protein [Polyangia bacterium]|nr:nuclear transport factor 2 family protein [Polyangia bacterium]
MRSEGSLAPEVEGWLRAFAGAVRAQDYQTAARELVEPDVIAFGTVAPRVVGVDVLAREQWRVIWRATADFDFDYASARAEVAGDRAWVAILWSSRGTDGVLAPRRAGRATFVLARGADGVSARWRAVHTHFSMMPEGPA